MKYSKTKSNPISTQNSIESSTIITDYMETKFDAASSVKNWPITADNLYECTFKPIKYITASLSMDQLTGGWKFIRKNSLNISLLNFVTSAEVDPKFLLKRQYVETRGIGIEYLLCI